MRSPREIAFRLRQEVRNARLAAAPPRLRVEAPRPLPELPEPAAVAHKLRETAFAAQSVQLADEIVAHRFPLLGFTIATGPEIEWRRDYKNKRSTDAKYFRLIPYLDVARTGDHKNIWELNRHQQLVVLAQAFLFTNRREYLDEIARQVESWWEQNPFQRGINWASALEVAFRAFSWIWIYHLVGDSMEAALRRRLLESLYQHGLHIENNLSFYFSPNTHLLGEAVVLHALGRLFPSFPHAHTWEKLGEQTVSHELKRQVKSDGSHFEQSTYYHVYALDMFLFHAVISARPADYRETLVRMADFLHALMGPRRSLAFLGDDDGGRWFHPYGARDEFGRATLATCATFLNRNAWTFEAEDLWPQAAWWLGRTEGAEHGPYKSRIFSDSGIALLECAAGRVIVDGGGFGPGRAGHSHSDSLSVLVESARGPILVDSGTYTYVGDPRQRDAFRGSGAHNTIRVDGRDQAVAMGPFWWGDPPVVRLLSWETCEAQDELAANCQYAGIMHRRVVRFAKPDWIFIVDRMDGPPGEHTIEQFWHLASADARRHVHLASAAEEFACEHSFVFGAKEAARCLVMRRRTSLPAMFASAISVVPDGRVSITERPDGAVFAVRSPYSLEVQLGMVL